MSEAVRIDRVGAVLTATIDRPAAYNALNADVLAGVKAAVAQAADDGARVVILTGSGDKAFSAGADLKELVGIDADGARRKMEIGHGVMRAVESSPVPVIAAVNGLALGGGFELVLSCTFPVLSTSATLGLPEAGLGLIPGYGGTQRLPRRIGAPAAAHLMLTGQRLDSQRAFDLGLTPVPPVAPEELANTVGEIAESIASKGPAAIRDILAAMRIGADVPLDAALAVERCLGGLALAGSESSEGIAAFLEKRPARFTDGLPGDPQ